MGGAAAWESFSGWESISGWGADGADERLSRRWVLKNQSDSIYGRYEKARERRKTEENVAKTRNCHKTYSRREEGRLRPSQGRLRAVLGPSQGRMRKSS